MSKFRGPGKWKSEALARTNTGSSIRGKISAPIPIVDDDEFPIRSPGSGIATPVGAEGIEKQLQLRSSVLARPESAAMIERSTPTHQGEPAIAEEGPSTSQPSFYQPSNSATTHTASTAVATSVNSIPPVTSLPPTSDGKPQRKKSSLRSVFGKLFGRKSRSDANRRSGDQSEVRAEQHRSVSLEPVHSVTQLKLLRILPR
jgi:hypothetical protein